MTITIPSDGYISPTSTPTSQPQLRVNGLYLEDGIGNRVTLKGMQADWNERVKLYGATWPGNSPEESWFTEDDIIILKAAGATCVEIQLMMLPDLMPTRNVPDATHFSVWVDKWADWCEQHQLYCILDISNFITFDGAGIWGLTTPSWLWEGLYATPTTQADYDIIVRDFFNLNIAKQDANRAAFVNLWKFIANRYKDNP